MNLLLDTHVLIWVFNKDPGLSPRTKEVIRDPGNQVFVSAVTAWEITIKKSLGRLDTPDDYEEMLERFRFTPLAITQAHALAVGALPSHHRDPFDRLLVAQAKLEKLTLVSRDRRLADYLVPILPA